MHARFTDHVHSQKQAHETAMAAMSRPHIVSAMAFELSWQRLTTVAGNFDLKYFVYLQRTQRGMETRMATNAQPTHIIL